MMNRAVGGELQVPPVGRPRALHLVSVVCIYKIHIQTTTAISGSNKHLAPMDLLQVLLFFFNRWSNSCCWEKGTALNDSLQLPPNYAHFSIHTSLTWDTLPRTLYAAARNKLSKVTVLVCFLNWITRQYCLRSVFRLSFIINQIGWVFLNIFHSLNSSSSTTSLELALHWMDGRWNFTLKLHAHGKCPATTAGVTVRMRGDSVDRGRTGITY